MESLTKIVSLNIDDDNHNYDVSLVSGTTQRNVKVFTKQHHAALIDGLGGLLQQPFSTETVYYP